MGLVNFRIPANVYISGSGQFSSSLTASAISASSITASLYTGSFKGDGSQLSGISATFNPSSDLSFNTGFGVVFSQNTIGGNIQANKLDDYEEGTWTPAYSGFTNNNPAVVANSAKYVKVGALVYFTVSFTLNNTANGSGAATITLPFSCNINGSGIMVTTTAALPIQGCTLSGNNITLGAFTATSNGLRITGTYFTNS